MDSSRTFFDITAALGRQRGYVAIFLAIGFVAAAAVFFLSPTRYSATSTMLMITEAPAYDLQHASLLTARPLAALDMASLVTSDAVLLQLQQQLGESGTLEALRKRIRAKSNGESTVMPIQYTDTTEHGAVRGSNLLASDVSAFYSSLATKRIDGLIADLGNQTKVHAQNLELLDAQLQSAAKQYPYIDVKDDDHSIYAKLVDLRTERDQAAALVAADESGARASLGFLDNARPVAMRDITESDPIFSNARTAYAKDVAELEHIESFGSKDYPGLPELNDIIGQDQATLADAKSEAAKQGPASNTAYATARDALTKAQAALESDRSRESAIDGDIDQIDDQLSEGGIGVKVAQIRRNREQEENLYGTLETRLSQAIGDRAEAAAEGSLIVMDPAQAAQPVIWSTGAFLAIGVLMMTLWLATTLGLERDRADRRFRTWADIETAYNSPVIGSLA